MLHIYNAIYVYNGGKGYIYGKKPFVVNYLLCDMCFTTHIENNN